MSILVRVRGLYSMGSLAKRTAVALLLLGATTAVAQSNAPNAELKTYQRDGGQTYFAISLSPQPDAAQQNQRAMSSFFSIRRRARPVCTAKPRWLQ